MKPALNIDQAVFPPFGGFQEEALAFLKRLKKNNNRPWFHKHKLEYEEAVKFPMQCLVASLASELSAEMPEIEFNPRKSVFRIYRDVRFSRNKAPYKTNIAAAFSVRGWKAGTESPGFYVHVEPGGVFLGGGLYMPDGDQLKAIRNSIVDDPERFLSILRERRFRREFGGIQGEKLVKAPLGFPKDHPMIEHLRHKQFFVGREMDELSSLKPSFLRDVSDCFRTALPFVRWLADVS
jgi:uncharacterized protein (TIGR02453 family)